MATKTIVRLADLSAGFITNSTASSTYATIASPTFTGTVNTAAVDMNGILDLNNYNITNVNNLEFNDAGAGEGLSWLGGNLWKVYESPDALTNSASGNFQIVQNATRRLTIDSATGNITTHKDLYIGDNRTSTETVQFTLGNGRTGSGYSHIDLVGDITYPDYGLRFIRNNTGANTTSQIIHRGTGQFNILAPDGGSIGLSTSNTNRLVIDSSGRVTKPAQPFFHVRSTQATTLGNDIFWTTIDNNVGSYYTSGNGRFTAPVAGSYYFSAHGLWANGDAGDFRVGLYKNGATVQGSNFISDKYAGRWLTFHINDIIYLAANDYVTVRYFQGGSALHTDSNYNGFTGWLLG
jgi:hypothetical protein